jgi:hypothetical protein
VTNFANDAESAQGGFYENFSAVPCKGFILPVLNRMIKSAKKLLWFFMSPSNRGDCGIAFLDKLFMRSPSFSVTV